jgi:hypothetical protein
MSDLAPEYGSGPADPAKVKEFWKDVVVPAARIGKLDKMPTVIAKTAKERDTARKQNYEISRHSFGGFHENYNHIKWKSTVEGKTA